MLQALATDIDLKPPAGYTDRAPHMDDMDAVVDLLNTWSQAKWGRDEFNIDDTRMEWSEPDLDIAQSFRLVHAEDGTLVGYIEVWDNESNPVHPWVWGRVHPEHEGKGIGTFISKWGIERAKRAVAKCTSEARVSLRMGTTEQQRDTQALFEHLGLTHFRDSWRMVIEMDDTPPAPEIPDGITIREYRHPDEFEAVVRADNEAFRDHFGHIEKPFEEELETWTHWVEEDAFFDPAYWFVAVDDATGEMAGVSICRKRSWGDPDMGHIGSLGVLRHYRKRGLGLALLRYSFGKFWERGIKAVDLGVDASSLTGATRLYEKAGMHVFRRTMVYELELRAGEEIATTSVDE